MRKLCPYAWRLAVAFGLFLCALLLTRMDDWWWCIGAVILLRAGIFFHLDADAELENWQYERARDKRRKELHMWAALSPHP